MGLSLPDSKNISSHRGRLERHGEAPSLRSGADCGCVIATDESEKKLSLSDFWVEQAIIQTSANLSIIEYKKILDKNGGEQERQKYPCQCSARISPFDIKEIRELMSEDEIELGTLGRFKKTGSKTGKAKNALFVIVSNTDDG
ncbi:MAG: hypothetical protein FWG30_09960 [Eubacteriaceae bacterium]|nr:hypothetical protein [Eubacteriaceae bacterium]